ncbi:hypothetical protein AAF712_003342 [Marasmius tenuissimus]|uniref:Uncharacterized protein n=1 Tax=Marasmius tenuissimus TaxID=585030 RepID=A0ABR3A9L3_9AGAR
MSKLASKRALPSKEAGLFKELLTLYETRQLKKGLKTSDQILKKYPEHGETLCMKGLVLTHMGRRDEGIEMVKKGVRFDLTSHIVWHVFGLIQKGEKNYEEALKSYTQALKFDKENLNILRDAAQLQTHLRLYDALVETRHKLLRMRPMVRQNWVALAVAHHLNGNLLEANKVLQSYETTLKNIPDYDVEHSETLIYHIRVLEGLEQFSEALSLLDTCAKDRSIVDKTAIMEFRARLTSKMGLEDAEHAWYVLIEHNSENYDYYQGYLDNLGVNTEENPVQAVKILYEKFITQLPKANTPKRLALSITPASFAGDEPVPSFKDQARRYLSAGLTKGIPSLFADVKSLYGDQEKMKIVEEIVEEVKKEHIPTDPSSSSEPTTYLWTLYFLAQHHSHLGHHTTALSLLDEATAHTPTLPELYTFRARVLKRAGDPIHAAGAMEEARLLDGQDRFLNTKSGKYLMRAGRQEEAEKVLGLFTKKDAVSPGTDLEDMQSLLYLMEMADSHLAGGRLHMALKKYVAVQKLFNELEDDQYDFHGYSLRKFNISIYLNLLSWEDRLRTQPAYIKAAVAASRILVTVHDNPSLKSPLGGNSSSKGKLSEAEAKAKKKAKKAAQKEARGQEEKDKKAAASANAATSNANEDKGLEPPTPKDEDPEGLKLLACEDPLERAAKLLQPLVELNLGFVNGKEKEREKAIEVWCVVYDVAVRRGKLLQAITALSRAVQLAGGKDHPDVHYRVVHARKFAASISSSSKPSASPSEDPTHLFLTELDKLISPEASSSLNLYNSQYLQQRSDSAKAVLSAAKVMGELLKNEATREEVEGVVFMVFNSNENDLDIKTAQSLLTFLSSLESSRAAEFRTKCQERFGLSTVFLTQEEREKVEGEVFGAGAAGAQENGEVEELAP